jgi:hypothetical protein
MQFNCYHVENLEKFYLKMPTLHGRVPWTPAAISTWASASMATGI